MRSSAIWRYGTAVAAVFTALLIREFLRPVLGNSNPYHTVWAAIVFAAWYCGLGPSILAALMAAAGVWFLFLPPYYSFAYRNRTDIVGIADFLVLAAFIIVLGETTRRGEAKRRQAELGLRLAEEETRIVRESAYQELERQVKERTAELQATNERLRELSARLMRSQDDERRKIARELHDTAGQYLAAVGMAIGAAQNEQCSPEAAKKLDQAAEITRTCTSEIRTISHLLHPPLLEELGLVSAIRWYVDGFTARSGIYVQTEMPDELFRLSNDVELVLFRVIQESLTNVHRHSGSKTATIRLRTDSQNITVEAQDQGKGSTKTNGSSGHTFRAGIGITGMRERVRDLAGSLEITSDDNGTLVRAVIPLHAPTTQSPIDSGPTPENKPLHKPARY